MLVAAISGLSNAAIFYHTGVRLVICCVAYGLDPNWWLPGLKTFHLPDEFKFYKLHFNNLTLKLLRWL